MSFSRRAPVAVCHEIRRRSRKSGSNQDVRRAFRSSSSAARSGSSRARGRRSARRSTRNFTPCGRALKRVRIRLRGLTEASMRAWRASRRAPGSGASLQAVRLACTASGSRSNSRARSRRNSPRPSGSRARYTRPSAAARDRARTSPPRASRHRLICSRRRGRSSGGRFGRRAAVSASYSAPAMACQRRWRLWTPRRRKLARSGLR